MSTPLSTKLSSALEKMIKYLAIGISLLFIVFVVMSIFRIGLVFWFYDRIFDWVSARLGFDYYLAKFFALSMTAIFSSLYPYLCWTFFTGRYKFHTTIAIIATSGVMCLLVYTVGSDVFFDRQTGRPLRWFADTPAGRVFSDSPGYDKKFGIKLVPFTVEIAQGEAATRQRAAEDRRRETDSLAKFAAEETRKKTEQQQRLEESRNIELERIAAQNRIAEEERQVAQEMARKAAEKVIEPNLSVDAMGFTFILSTIKRLGADLVVELVITGNQDNLGLDIVKSAGPFGRTSTDLYDKAGNVYTPYRSLLGAKWMDNHPVPFNRGIPTRVKVFFSNVPTDADVSSLVLTCWGTWRIDSRNTKGQYFRVSFRNFG